jgi:hypothetical protein
LVRRKMAAHSGFKGRIMSAASTPGQLVRPRLTLRFQQCLPASSARAASTSLRKNIRRLRIRVVRCSRGHEIQRGCRNSPMSRYRWSHCGRAESRAHSAQGNAGAFRSLKHGLWIAPETNVLTQMVGGHAASSDAEWRDPD